MHPGYFVGARHDRTIGVRPLLRPARENADRELPAGDREQPQNVCVVSGRRSRATPTTARTVKNLLGHVPQIGAGESELESPAGAKKTCDARRSEQCQGKRECRAAKAEGGAERHQALALAPPRRCLPPPHTHPTTLRRTRRRRHTTQTATWPQQAPPPHRGPAGRRPRSRCSDSCRAPPRLALYPLPALAQRTAHHDRPCKQASGC